MQHLDKTLLQHTSENTDETLETDLIYNHCNICNISIYFCNIRMKQLQHTYKTLETHETYACNMRFQHVAIYPCCLRE
jgi:hypothetical protein